MCSNRNEASVAMKELLKKFKPLKACDREHCMCMGDPCELATMSPYVKERRL